MLISDVDGPGLIAYAGIPEVKADQVKFLEVLLGKAYVTPNQDRITEDFNAGIAPRKSGSDEERGRIKAVFEKLVVFSRRPAGS